MIYIVKFYGEATDSGLWLHSGTTDAEIRSILEQLWFHQWLRFGTPSGFGGSKLIHLFGFGTWWLHQWFR